MPGSAKVLVRQDGIQMCCLEHVDRINLRCQMEAGETRSANSRRVRDIGPNMRRRLPPPPKDSFVLARKLPASTLVAQEDINSSSRTLA